MGRETWNKKQNEKKKIKKREDKARRKEERKANATDGSLNNMIAYVDEFGNFSSTPPDPAQKTKVKAENIEISVPSRENDSPGRSERHGRVTMFDESKGYGFIKDSETSESYFTHVNQHAETIRANDNVTFRIERSHKGANAVDVKLASK